MCMFEFCHVFVASVSSLQGHLVAVWIAALTSPPQNTFPPLSGDHLDARYSVKQQIWKSPGNVGSFAVYWT